MNSDKRRYDKRRYLSVEAPDTTATVDFLGKYGFTVQIVLGADRNGEPEVYVKVTAVDDRSTILGEIVALVPEADNRR